MQCGLRGDAAVKGSCAAGKFVKLRMDKNFCYTFSLFADGSLSPLACIRPFAREGL